MRDQQWMERDAAYQRVYRMAEAMIATWPRWKQAYAAEDNEVFASYRTQMHAGHSGSTEARGTDATR